MSADKDKSRDSAADELRRRAEEIIGEAEPSDAQRHRRNDETLKLFHELQVHQIELEMQNAELRQVRDEVESALAKYTDLYDFAPVGYLTLNRNGVVLAANLTAAGLLGIERSRLTGRHFELFVAAEARQNFAEFLGTVFLCKSRQSCEVTISAEGNLPFFVQIEAVAFESEQEQECRVAMIDISVRRQLEEKLEIMHTDLSARAVELEIANIELEAFNYSVSHDLRSPLTVINSYCQVVLELCGNNLNEECRGYIREMYAGTLRMNQLIDSLLDFSRIKHVEMRGDKIDLSKMANEVALGLSLSAPERRVTFRIASGVTVEGDAGLLRVVLDNLIGNAWKYTGSQAETVIEFGVTKVKGKPACFVRDNGPGFDMEHADRLFIPFQRLPGAKAEGHGIGLATVERIVRRHGGRVWAESEPGKGATFLFTLENQ